MVTRTQSNDVLERTPQGNSLQDTMWQRSIFGHQEDASGGLWVTTEQGDGLVKAKSRWTGGGGPPLSAPIWQICVEEWWVLLSTCLQCFTSNSTVHWVCASGYRT